MFGGVSLEIKYGVDPDAKYEPNKRSDGSPNEYGWNNEYFEMDLQTSKQCVLQYFMNTILYYTVYMKLLQLVCKQMVIAIKVLLINISAT